MEYARARSRYDKSNVFRAPPAAVMRRAVYDTIIIRSLRDISGGRFRNIRTVKRNVAAYSTKALRGSIIKRRVPRRILIYTCARNREVTEYRIIKRAHRTVLNVIIQKPFQKIDIRASQLRIIRTRKF